MQIDTTHFPLVWMSKGSSAQDWEAQLDALLARGERFVLLIRHETNKPEQNDSEQPDLDQKRRFAHWLKRSRPQLKKYCAGSIVIVRSATLTMLLKPVMQPLAKAFGIPVRIVEESQFDAEASRLLAAS